MYKILTEVKTECYAFCNVANPKIKVLDTLLLYQLFLELSQASLLSKRSVIPRMSINAIQSSL